MKLGLRFEDTCLGRRVERKSVQEGVEVENREKCVGI